MIGCTFNYPYYAGMKYNQTETLRNSLQAGDYYKNCIYTRFEDADNYNYDCTWMPINGLNAT